MTKKGPELLAEVSQYTNLDRFLDRNPKLLSEGERREMIEGLRRDRALFIKDDDEKRRKRREGSEDD